MYHFDGILLMNFCIEINIYDKSALNIKTDCFILFLRAGNLSKLSGHGTTVFIRQFSMDSHSLSFSLMCQG